MAKGLPRSLARGKGKRPGYVVETIKVKDLAISVADGAPGFGTAVLAALPSKNILFLGAVSYLQFFTSDADVIAAWTGNYAIGSAPTADNAFAGAEVDIISDTAIAAATAKLSPMTRGASGAGTIANVLLLDNTAGTLELNLQLAVADLSISGAAVFTANGVVHISYVLLGDD